MINVNFYDNDYVPEKKLKYVVIMAEYKGKWIMVRHRERTTWEVPGGHIEANEEVMEAAKRELYEETGARDFKIKPVSIYSVSINNGEESFGELLYAQVEELGELPDSEIEEVKLVQEIIGNLTYPEIQPRLADKVIEVIK